MKLQLFLPCISLFLDLLEVFKFICLVTFPFYMSNSWCMHGLSLRPCKKVNDSLNERNHDSCFHNIHSYTWGWGKFMTSNPVDIMLLHLTTVC